MNAVQVHVSGLRKLLGPEAAERLQTRGTGYELALEPGELDCDRFVALLADGRGALAASDPARAGEALREALALWRGQALADFLYEPFAQPEIARLEELRLAGLEDRIEADLALGRHADLVGELEALVAGHPLRERLRGQLMLALYRSGRQAEALEAYQEARLVLVEELGIEPSPPLRALEAAILRQDESLAVPEPTAGVVAEPAAPEPLAAPEAADVRKVVTVLACDVADAASLAERLDPEPLRRVLGRFLEAASGTVARHGGAVERLRGDAIKAVFGMPRLHEDDAIRAVRAACDLREAVATLDEELERAWGARFRLRIGVDTGEVVASPGGPLQPSVTGDVVGRAEALERAAPADGILIGEATHRLVGAEILGGSAGEISRDRGAPVQAFAVSAIAPEPDAYPPSFETPMVGREAERALVAEAFERAVAERGCRMVTVLAPAGIGKSRLAAEAAGALADRARVLRGRCLPYGEDVAFRPVLDVLRQAAGAVEGDEPPSLLRRVEDVLEGDEDAEAVAGRLGELLGLVEGQATSEETSWAVRRALEALARRRPVICVLEDLHWAEPALLDLVEYVRDWTHDAPVLLVALARPELLDLRPSWARRPGDELVFLEPLAEDEAERLLEGLLGALSLSPAVRSRIAAAAEGNPLFLEQLLAMVAESGEAGGVDGEGSGPLAVPPTIHALLAARLDALPAEERAVAERAAVIGRTFSWEAVRELVPDADRPYVGERLSALVRRELLSPERPGAAAEHAFRFRHALIRDAAYAAIPKEARAEHHARYADWLAGRPGDQDEALGHQLEQAVRYRAELGLLDERDRGLAAAAGERLHAAGRRALARGDLAAAERLLERAAWLCETSGEPRALVLVDLGVTRREAGDLAAAEEALARAAELAATLGDDRARALAAIERSSLAALVDPGDVAALRAAAEEALPVFERAGDEAGIARAWREIAIVHWGLCECGAMEAALEHALVHAERAGDERGIGEAIDLLVRAIVVGPTPAAGGIERCRALRLRADGHDLLEAWIDALTAVLVAMQGGADEARRLLAESKERFAGRGSRMVLAGVHQYAGMAELVLVDPAAAEREFRAGYELYERMGERGQRSTTAALLARALHAQGRLDEAGRFARVSAETAAADDLASQVMWRLVEAKLRARADGDGAERLAREAVARVRASDFLNIQADALSDLTDVLVRVGRRAEAEAVRAEALALYEAKGNVVAAAALRTAAV